MMKIKVNSNSPNIIQENKIISLIILKIRILFETVLNLIRFTIWIVSKIMNKTPIKDELINQIGINGSIVQLFKLTKPTLAAPSVKKNSIIKQIIDNANDS